jgi:glycosyltransferase involved in cell wall biosynthesis
MRRTVTGLVLTFNGERLLEACLASLDFCDRILVVDSQSTDATRDIAATHHADVLVRAWEGPVPQFRFALERIDTDWVVSLDQDEALSDELRASILKMLESDDGGGPVGYYCPRRSFYFDRLLRVWRNGRMDVSASGPHYSFHPQGPTARLAGDIVHHPYENLHAHLDKLNYYTQEAADELYEKGRRSGLLSALGHGAARFLKIYVVRRGFLDGQAGLILAIHGFLYAFHKYIRVTERARRGEERR